MTAIVWDQVGERRFETGIDRGVLYLPDEGAVPWNGLTQVTEDREREIKSYYMDGVKYLDHAVADSFSGKIQAFTYPDELEPLLGTTAFVPGVFVHDQRPILFSLSYRTKIGNDLDGVDHGYKIHILYNLLAVPAGTTIKSIGGNAGVDVFEWTLSGSPATMYGIRPTNHISVDSRLADPAVLTVVEEMLYGTETEDPNLMSLVELLAFIEGMSS